MFIIMFIHRSMYSCIVFYFQDLQIEIDTERENYLNLTATGRKILSQIEGQEDASIIQKRLEEMNQRWNYLKAKSIAIRLVIFLSIIIFIQFLSIADDIMNVFRFNCEAYEYMETNCLLTQEKLHYVNKVHFMVHLKRLLLNMLHKTKRKKIYILYRKTFWKNPCNVDYRVTCMCNVFLHSRNETM